MRDIQNIEDIRTVVNLFYRDVRTDALLGPVFAANIPDEQWPAHLERMYAFWNAILFSERGFEGNPMLKHMKLPINEEHFSQWLHLFTSIIDRNFCGVKADEAKQRALSIGRIMNFKINTLRP